MATPQSIESFVFRNAEEFYTSALLSFPEENPSCMVSQANTTPPVTFHPSFEADPKYRRSSGKKFCPSEQQLVGRYLYNRIDGTFDDEMQTYIKDIDVYKFEPPEISRLYALQDGNIFCFTSLRKFKNGSKNINRKTREGHWSKSQPDCSVFNEEKTLKLGTKTSLVYYDREKRKTQWLMKQYVLDESQWPNQKEEDCRKLALCVIYNRGKGGSESRSCADHNESSSISSTAEYDQNLAPTSWPMSVPCSGSSPNIPYPCENLTPYQIMSCDYSHRFQPRSLSTFNYQCHPSFSSPVINDSTVNIPNDSYQIQYHDQSNTNFFTSLLTQNSYQSIEPIVNDDHYSNFGHYYPNLYSSPQSDSYDL